MQRFLTFLLMFFAVSLAAHADVPERPLRAETLPAASAATAPAPQAEVELSPLARIEPPAADSVDLPGRQSDAALPAVANNPHIALLLPLKSSAFGRAAEVVRQGFMAGASIQPGALPVTVYSSSDDSDDIVSTYRQATQAGASIVVGPLTRSGVSALAASAQVSVPTLALNLPDQSVEFPPQLYVFGLAADLEARQMARNAFGEGRRSVTVIASADTLSKRIQQAFAEEWLALGGNAARHLIFTGTNPTEIRDALRRQAPNVVFLAMDSRDARFLNPFLKSDLPTYATSQIFAGSGSLQKYHDLNGVQFVDMPWLLQPDHLAVMVYPRPKSPLSADLERLYALGIDAWRLALQLRTSPGLPLSLDGVTGQLTLDVRSHQVNRDGVRAEFSSGEAVLLAP
jgi:hypothetical protein